MSNGGLGGANGQWPVTDAGWRDAACAGTRSRRIAKGRSFGAPEHTTACPDRLLCLCLDDCPPSPSHAATPAPTSLSAVCRSCGHRAQSPKAGPSPGAPCQTTRSLDRGAGWGPSRGARFSWRLSISVARSGLRVGHSGWVGRWSAPHLLYDMGPVGNIAGPRRSYCVAPAVAFFSTGAPWLDPPKEGAIDRPPECGAETAPDVTGTPNSRKEWKWDWNRCNDAAVKKGHDLPCVV